MRNMKIRDAFLIGSTVLLSGCSFLVDLAFYNNSEEDIEVCNLSLNEPRCNVIAAGALEKVLMVADRPATFWRFSIRKGEKKEAYEFPSGRYPELASNVYCEGFLQKRCDIPVQYESSGRIYWGGKTGKLPVADLPNQPKGFPIEPGA